MERYNNVSKITDLLIQGRRGTAFTIVREVWYKVDRSWNWVQFFFNWRKREPKYFFSYSSTKREISVNRCDWHILESNEWKIVAHCLNRWSGNCLGRTHLGSAGSHYDFSGGLMRYHFWSSDKVNQPSNIYNFG